MQLTLFVANITVATSFHQFLGVKPCFEMKFCQKFPYEIYFSDVLKVVAQSTTFCNLILWLIENLGVISTLENISTEMDND